MKKVKAFSIIVIVGLAASLLAGCAKPTPAVVEPVATSVVEATPQPQTEVVVQTKLDTTPRIAVMSAFYDENVKVLEEAEIERTIPIAGTNYHIGKLMGNDVVVFLSGVSMINAGMKTQAAIDYFEIESIVFTGIAGGVNPSLNIGDVVVPAQWGQYLESYLGKETAPGVYAPPYWLEGAPPEYPPFLMMYPGSTNVVHEGGEADAYEAMFWFRADEEMLAVARAVAESIELEKCADECLSSQPIIKVGGNGVSGQSFVDNAAFRNYAWRTFTADALDMESAAVAHVAYTNDIPYIAFRSLSDLAGGGPGMNEIGTFFQLAADNSAKVLLAYLEAWALGQKAEEAEPIKACFVYVGPVGDHGWTWAHDQGRKYLETSLENVETVYLESVSDVDSEARIRDLAEQGCDVIFTTSASFRDSTAVVALEYPDVIFENCSGFLTSENMGSYFGRMEQAKYLAGVVAGLTTQTNKIGYVAPIQIPEIIRLMNAVALGARSVNPDVELEVMWVGNWFDPPAETAAVQSMVDAGVDVIFTGTDTTVPVVTADGEGVWSVGYDSCESCEVAPDKCLTTPCWNWGPIYVDLVNAIRDGTWEPETIYRSMAEGTVILTEIGPSADEAAQAAVDEAKTQMELSPSQWPFCATESDILDNHGNVLVPAGQCLTDLNLICMDRYVEGINSEVPEGVGCE